MTTKLPENSADGAGGPCAGLRVIDMSSLVSGPYCGQILADLGAEVIKVETPGSDGMRQTPPFFRGEAAGFEQHNRGKKSVLIDIKTDEGRQAVHALARTADIFIQNSRPGVMERLGFGYPEMRSLNPRLIYLSISGFGEDGPYAGRPAYDLVIQALTGFMPEQGSREHPEPVRSMVADRITAIWASNAALAALVHRARSGEGQKIVVSMLTAYAAFILPGRMGAHTYAEAPPAEPGKRSGIYDYLYTSDGQVIGMLLQRQQFERLVGAIGREDMLADPRFQTATGLIENVVPLYAELNKTTRGMTTQAFLTVSAEAGVPFSKVNTIEDFFDDPQVKASQAYVDFDDPDFGGIRHLNYPAVFERSPVDVARRAPRLGEHSDELDDMIASRPRQGRPA